MYQNTDEIKQFISSIFKDLEPEEHTIFWGCRSTKPGFPVSYETFFERSLRSTIPKACYFSTSTVRPDEDGKLFNRQKLFQRMFCIVLDDIGNGIGAKCTADKLPEVLATEYSWRIETSPGNFQYGYLLDKPIEDLNAAIEFVKIIYGAGEWDSGGATPNKLVRLPCGYNLKTKYATDGELWEVGHANDAEATESYCTEFNMFSPDELLSAVNAGVNWADIKTGTAGKKDPRRTRGTTAWREGAFSANLEGVVDDALDWLNEKELVVNENNEWIDVICPWHEDHTDNANTAGYKPLGYGDNPDRRAFHCFHGHCASRNTPEFLAWVGKNGGPLVPMVDPVPSLVSRWALDAITSEFIDMHSDRRLRIPNAGFKLSHQQDVFWTGLNDKPAKATQYGLIVKSDGLLRLSGSQYLPGAPRIIEYPESKMFNDWYVPNWSLTKTESYDSDCKNFVSFLEYLMPNGDDAQWFLDHLAAKVQDPKYRGPCALLTTPVHGSGRGTLGKMLKQLWGGHNISTVNLSELIDGFEGAQGSYNDWMQAAWVIVPEAKESNMTRRQESRAYESLKTGIDPQPTSHLIKTKYGSQITGDVFSSTLISSNHEGVLNIPVTDRRFLHISCAVKAASPQFFIDFSAWLETSWESNVWLMLLNRDISHHNGFAPQKDIRDVDDYEDALIFSLSGQSPIDRLATIAVMFANAECNGLLHIKTLCHWIAEFQVQLGVSAIPNWEPIFKANVRGLSAELKKDGKRKAFSIEGTKTFVRYTLTDIGYNTSYTINDTSDFSSVRDVVLCHDAEEFRDYVLEIFNEADL